VLGEDPLSGSVFVFCKRRGNDWKLVVWERTGWCLVAKRLEHGRLRLPGDAPTQELRTQVFPRLRDGIALGPRR
jgi:transposase